jgi:GNAT superfamily N-acetyltransferase
MLKQFVGYWVLSMKYKLLSSGDEKLLEASERGLFDGDIQPDKPDELWINEVAVVKAYRRKGIADALLKLLFQCGRELGCKEAWVLADESNTSAHQLYSKLGGIPKKQIMYSFKLGDTDRG